MICPHCKKAIKLGTPLQIEVYDKVCLRGLTQEQAASVLGVSQQAVSRALSRLFKIHKHLFKGGAYRPKI